MSKSIDPLSILREYTINNTPITLSDSDLQFSKTKLPLSTQTAWKSKIPGKYYTLGALWLFLKNRNSVLGDYIRETKNLGVEIVSQIAKTGILEYFTGKVENTGEIDEEMRASTLIYQKKHGGVRAQRVGGSGGSGGMSSGMSTGRDTIQGIQTHQPTESNKRENPYNSEEQKEQEPKIERPPPTHSKERAQEHQTRYEKQLHTRHSLLQSTQPLFGVLLLIPPSLLPRHQFKRKYPEDSQLANARLLGINTNILKKKRTRASLLEEILRAGYDLTKAGRPIIVVPTSPIKGGLCIYNAVEFLRDGEFLDPFVEKERVERGEKVLPPRVLFKHKVQGREVLFEVRDEVSAFTAHHWGRVVGVFVIGHQWQFKGWGGDTIVTLFLKYRGFFMKFHDTVAPKTVTSWNVHLLDVNRNYRHLDRSLQVQFWGELANFILRPRYREIQYNSRNK